MFIDIHNHTLFGVDDGPKHIELAKEMLLDAKKQDALAIILTPHYRRGMFGYPLAEIEENFQKLKDFSESIGIQLFLGCEYHVNSEIITNIQSGRCKTLAGSDYVLTEYSHETEYSYIAEQTNCLISCGYIPVIAHVERYKCIQKKPQLCAELSHMGALIQVNADSILGLEGFKTKRLCKKMLSQEWIDIVASDSHDMTARASHMKQCKINLEKRYGEEYADQLFIQNPMRILKNR